MSSFVLLRLNTVDLAYHYLNSDAKITYCGSNKIILAGASGLDTEDTENPMCMYLLVSLLFLHVLLLKYFHEIFNF